MTIAGPSVVFRCDGFREIGLGHVGRCLALAEELKGGYGCDIAFAMRHGPVGFDMVRQAGYPVFILSGGIESFDYANWLVDVIGSSGAQVFVLDVRDDLPPAVLDALRGRGIRIVTIDDPSERRLNADLAFYPPVPQVRRMDWTNFRGRLYVGWEWVVIRSGFACTPVRPPNKPPRVLVTMGGSDPAGLTLKVVEAIGLMKGDFVPVVLLGPGFSYEDALADLLAISRHRFEVIRSHRDMPGLLAGVDLAIATSGVTAYELAAMGVPAIYLCLTDDHTTSAAVFDEQGMGINLGLHSTVSPTQIISALSDLLDHPDKRDTMGKMARSRVDGMGSKRIADLIVNNLRTEQGGIASPATPGRG